MWVVSLSQGYRRPLVVFMTFSLLLLLLFLRFFSVVAPKRFCLVLCFSDGYLSTASDLWAAVYKFRPDLFQCVANAYADVGAFFFRFIVLLLFSCFENATVFPMGSQRFSDLLFSRFPRIQWPRKSQDVLCHGNNKSPKSETPKRNFFLFLSCFGFVVFWCEDTKNWCSSSEKQSWQDPYSAGIIKEKAEIAAGHSGWQAAAGWVKNGRQARMTPCACCGISALRGPPPLPSVPVCMFEGCCGFRQKQYRHSAVKKMLGWERIKNLGLWNAQPVAWKTWK